MVCSEEMLRSALKLAETINITYCEKVRIPCEKWKWKECDIKRAEEMRHTL